MFEQTRGEGSGWQRGGWELREAQHCACPSVLPTPEGQ